VDAGADTAYGMSGRIVAWSIWGVAMTLSAAALALLAASWNAAVPDSWGFRGFQVLFAVPFTTIGAIIVARRPNVVGWILVAVGALSGLQAFAEEYGIYGIIARPDGLPGAIWFAWLSSWIWVFVVGTVAIHLVLFYPDGRLPSPAWWPLAVAGALAMCGVATGLALAPGPLNNAPYVDNPIGLVPLGSASVVAGVFAVVAALAAATTASAFYRFRRAVGIERQQLKWLAYFAALLAIAVLVGSVGQAYKPAQLFLIAAATAVPFAIGLAVMRYRLYEIDVIIRRTLIYGVLSATLVGVYVAAVLALQYALSPFTTGNALVVAGSTLVAVALFQPLRERIRRAVDQRFYRSRYDAQATIDAFAVRLRNEIDLDALASELLDVVSDTVRPAWARLWLRKER